MSSEPNATKGAIHMGYTTDFDGRFSITPPLKPEHKAYLDALNSTRRMQRDETKVAALPDPVRLAVGLPIGPNGAFFVGGGGFMGQEPDESVTGYNSPPTGQPNLWCQWQPTEDGEFLKWDDGEKFYNYVEWLEYIVEQFLKPWGYVLAGEVSWNGEEPGDTGIIYAKDNRLEAVTSEIVNAGPSWANTLS